MSEDGFFQIIYSSDKLVVTEIHFAKDRLGRGINEDGRVLPGHQLIYGEESARSGNCHTPEKPVEPRLLSDPVDEELQHQPAGKTGQNNVGLKQQPDQDPVQHRLIQPLRPEYREADDQQGDDAVGSRHDGGVVAKSNASQNDDLQHISERCTEEKQNRRDTHKHKAHSAEVPEGHAKFCKRADDQKPQTGVPFNAEIGKELRQRGVFRNRPGLCLITESLVV